MQTFPLTFPKMNLFTSILLVFAMSTAVICKPQSYGNPYSLSIYPSAYPGPVLPMSYGSPAMYSGAAAHYAQPAHYVMPEEHGIAPPEHKPNKFGFFPLPLPVPIPIPFKTKPKDGHAKRCPHHCVGSEHFCVFPNPLSHKSFYKCKVSTGKTRLIKCRKNKVFDIFEGECKQPAKFLNFEQDKHEPLNWSVKGDQLKLIACFMENVPDHFDFTNMGHMGNEFTQIFVHSCLPRFAPNISDKKLGKLLKLIEGQFTKISTGFKTLDEEIEDILKRENDEDDDHLTDLKLEAKEEQTMMNEQTAADDELIGQGSFSEEQFIKDNVKQSEM